MLICEAKYWWHGASQLMESSEEAITGASLKEHFLRKYFPIGARHAKEMEFLRLIQENMTMNEYSSKFEYLSRFCT